MFDASYGKLDLTKEEAALHNAALDKALVDGLDKNCQIGQGGYAYFNHKAQVTTFIGTVLAEEDAVTRPGNLTIQFTRKGKTYRGRLSTGSDVFNYRRVS